VDGSILFRGAIVVDAGELCGHQAAAVAPAGHLEQNALRLMLLILASCPASTGRFRPRRQNARIRRSCLRCGQPIVAQVSGQCGAAAFLVLRRDKSSRLEVAELLRSKKIVDFFSRRTFFTFGKSTIIFYEQ